MYRRTLAAVVIDERTEWTLGELSQVCRVDRRTLVALVEAGILVPKSAEPAGTASASSSDPSSSQAVAPTPAPGGLRFAGDGLARARRALRVARELDLDPHATAVVLGLLDEIERLRARLRQSGG